MTLEEDSFGIHFKMSVGETFTSQKEYLFDTMSEE